MRSTKLEYMMHLAVVASSRSTCDRRHVGCVIASQDGRILSSGYNGSAPGADHCDDVGHLMLADRCVRTIHAEANAVAGAARTGTSIMGSTAYSTTRPCPACLLLLASAGVRKVVYLEPYHAAEDEITATTGGAIEIEQYVGGTPWV